MQLIQVNASYPERVDYRYGSLEPNPVSNTPVTDNYGTKYYFVLQ